jgi:hypothetical protein
MPRESELFYLVVSVAVGHLERRESNPLSFSDR